MWLMYLLAAGTVAYVYQLRAQDARSTGTAAYVVPGPACGGRGTYPSKTGAVPTCAFQNGNKKQVC